MTAGHNYGIYNIQIAKLNAAGYPVGIVADPETISNGTTSSAYRISHPIELGAPTFQRGTVAFSGGMKMLGQRSTGLESVGTFPLRLSAYDDVFNALVTGSAVSETAFGTSNRASIANNNLTSPPQFMLIADRAKAMTTGATKHETVIYLNAQIVPGSIGPMNQNTGTNPAPTEYTVVVSQHTRVLGMLVSASGLSAEDDSDYFVRIESDEAFGFTFYKDDGSATSVTMGYRPYRSDNDNSRNLILKNGADASSACSGMNTSTGVATITAGTAADMWAFFYQTRFRAI